MPQALNPVPTRTYQNQMVVPIEILCIPKYLDPPKYLENGRTWHIT